MAWLRYEPPWPTPSDEPMIVRRVAVGGVTLAVETSGRGPACLVLHGFTGSARAMRPLTDGLDAALVVPDLIGHGETDAPTEVGPYRMEAIVAQLHGVLDALAIDEAVVVGYSFGARVGLSFAVAHPERVRHLVTIGGTAGLADADEAAARRRSDEALAADIEDHGVETFVDRWEQAPIFASQHELPDHVRATIRAGRLANRAVGLANSLRGAGTGAMPPVWEALPTLSVAYTVAAGARDEKFVAIGRRMVELAPHALLEIVAGAGHAAHIESPAACQAIVQQALGSA